MIKLNRVLIILVSIVLSLFLIGCTGSIGQPDDPEQVDTESELPEQTEPLDEDETEPENDSDNDDSDQKQTGGSGTQPYPGSGFKHEVEMKIDGVIETDQNEEWWVLD